MDNLLKNLQGMIAEAEHAVGNVDGWVFICHPDCWLAELEEFDGHEICKMRECPVGTVYFSRDFRQEDTWN